ncbi:MAG: hypothetical protein H6868_03820 [Rhodospirillales bacterium]|nr:hypothetical protein [Rhodospirillales bacterium]
MVANVGNILTAVQQKQLFAIQTTARSLDGAQGRLASGLRVNSAIDNPQNFFAARSLNNRASDLSRLLDGIGQSILTIETADKGLRAAEKILDQLETYLLEYERAFLNGEIDVTATEEGPTYLGPAAIGDLQSYAGAQDIGGTVALLGGGESGFYLDGNLWKRLQVDYDVTANTVLEFDFRSTNIPEIAGIGFDNDTNFSNSNNQFFLYGTQLTGVTYAAPTGTYQYSGGGSWVHVTIPVGAYFTGTFSHLTFINDDDGAGDDGDSYYRNLLIHEGDGGITQGPDAVDQKYEDEYQKMLGQLDFLVNDAHYRGINLLRDDTLTTYLNEDRTSFIQSEGIDATADGLGLGYLNFAVIEDVQDEIGKVRETRETLRRYITTLATDLNVIKTREDTTRAVINILETGADELTLADQNQEGAKLLALQVRQQIQFASFAKRPVTIADFLL